MILLCRFENDDFLYGYTEAGVGESLLLHHPPGKLSKIYVALRWEGQFWDFRRKEGAIPRKFDCL